jgi:SAM-dependent methyltransferase
LHPVKVSKAVSKEKLMSVKLPWWTKIGAKMFLSRLPFGYRTWQRLGLFRHGHMDQSGYLSQVFDTHMSRAGIRDCLTGKTILELGPGDSVGTALVAASYGARAILLDAGAFAVSDVDFYRKLAHDLTAMGLQSPDIREATTLGDVLEACDAVYLTEGLLGFSGIASGTVDVIFSQAVLEHVRKSEFAATMRECRRVLSSDGVASHRVDLKDHLGGGLNNLRFSEGLWESSLFVKSGFYTNRIRYSEMLSQFKNAAFDVEVVDVDRWDGLPIARSKLDGSFADLSDDELMIRGFDVLLRPAG